MRSLPALPLLVLLGSACAASTAPPAAPPAPCKEAIATPLAPAPPADAASSQPKEAAHAFDPAPWLEDLDALTKAMSAHYANLDFQIRERHLDLARVKRRAEDRLRAATSVDQAQEIFWRFFRAFGDGHLDFDWSPRPEGPSAKPEGGLCKRLGYEEREPGGVDFTLVPGFTPIDDADAHDVPGGVLQLSSGPKIGVLRIGLFTDEAHPALCEAARADLKLADDATCDEKCADRVRVAAGNRLTAALERRAASLAHAGAKVLLVDVTGNGGGNNWVDPATRALTPAKIEERAMGAVRHEHWVKQLEERIHDLETELAAHGDVEHGAIAAAIAKFRAALADVKTPCDKSALWQGQATVPACSQLVLVPPVVGYAKPGALSGRGDPGDLFGPAHYDYHEGANTLPLAALVDANTASAAEHFAEMLQDAHAATVVGVQTLGAGCGFTEGGIPTVLPRSGAHVRMPDCARVRADGSNAVAGVAPDVVLPLLNRDSPYQRAVKVVAGLQASWKTIVARAPRAR